MVEAGIGDGDITVKYLYKRRGRIKLTTANPTFPEITCKEGQQLIICGVVTAAIKHHWAGASAEVFVVAPDCLEAEFGRQCVESACPILGD